MQRLPCLLLVIIPGITSSFAANGPRTVAPQPAPSCITTSFGGTGSSGWTTASLTVTNTCSTGVDFQNSLITFQNSTSLATSYWWQSASMSYPAAPTQITSQAATGGGYTASIPIQFESYTGVITKLAPGKTFTIFFGVPKTQYTASSVKVWLGSAIQTGEIDLTNASAQPTSVSATEAVVDVALSGQIISKINLPWKGTFALSGLAAGSYTLQPESVTDASGNVYQGTAVPASVTVQAGGKVASTVSYAPVTLPGSISIEMPALSATLSGYTGTPVITFIRADTGSSFTQAVAWNAKTIASSLANNVSYSFSTPVIAWNANKCTATFAPATAISSAVSSPLVGVSYTCVPVQQDKVTLNVSGASSSSSSVTVTFIPSDGSATVNQPVTLTGGAGSTTVNLADGVMYNVSSSAIQGYAASFSPQPLTVSASATETVTFQQQTGGRVITYVPGWKTPPSASAMATAGYTHAIVAFGVFSTTQPGVIVPDFSTVTQSYINSLHAAGIKVLLSLGGASTSTSGTSINFHSVLSAASSATAFQQTFVKSAESIVSQYGFDGLDFDIESGLNAGGTFANPTGDIATLAAIINQLHADNPALLISLVPQTANIAATGTFDATFGNYSSLVMQTHAALSWVGVQVYNAGCMFGINAVCYDPDITTSPDASVSLAVDLLANWPATAGDINTGFLPYISYLTPDQVVLGYLAPNNTGAGDGTPVYPVATIKRSLQCLLTATAGADSCDTYVPPKAYAGFGGVFNWEVTYDEANNYAWALGLKACALQGNCS